LSDHRGKILRVVCHKPSPRWRSNNGDAFDPDHFAIACE
jgi:hypothetical protein